MSCPRQLADIKKERDTMVAVVRAYVRACRRVRVVFLHILPIFCFLKKAPIRIEIVYGSTVFLTSIIILQTLWKRTSLSFFTYYYYYYY